MNRIDFQLGASAYFADKIGSSPTLNQSTAHRLVSQSPYHGWLYHPKLGGKSEAGTGAMDAGSIIDQLVLSGGVEDTGDTGSPDRDAVVKRAGRVCAVDVRKADGEAGDGFRTKAAKAARNEIEKAGGIAVTLAKFREYEHDADDLIVEIARLGYHLHGKSQVTIFWEHQTFDGPVQCRARLDHLLPATGHIIDLKRVKSAHPDALDRHIYTYGIDIQAAAYREAVETVCPELAGRVRFTLLCVEGSTNVVTPVELAGSMRQVGEYRWRRGVDCWRRCLAGGTTEEYWPRYVRDGEVHRAEARPWMMPGYEEQGESDAAE